MIFNIRFPFMIVKTDYLKEHTQKTEARLNHTIGKLNEKIRSVEKLHEKMQKDKDSISRDIKYWREQFSAFAEQPCLECGKDIVVQPFGDKSYYIERDGIVHPHCVDKYRKRPDWKSKYIKEELK